MTKELNNLTIMKIIQVIKDWSELIATITAIIAVIISICTLRQTNKESYLSHRAYVGPTIWNTSDGNNQFQISFTNSGNTPAVNFYVIGRLIIDERAFSSSTLAEGQMLLPGLGDTNPKVPFNFSSADINRLASSPNGYVQIEFGYTDYLGKSHIQRTNFKLFILNEKYQIQPIKQIIIK